MKGTVISYLSRIAKPGEKDNPTVFDFRIHQVKNVEDSESVSAQVLEDRGQIPPDCRVDWYR